MLKWYSNLYIGEGAKKKAKTIIRKINTMAGQLGIYVITLAINPDNHLEIIPSYLLLQSNVYNNCPMIVGIASGYDEALSLITMITNEVYEKMGNTDIRTFIENEEAMP